ncbi:MAG: hypothetical protein FJ387_30710, partial [Verrucomicrobia bacterium]|nr:hypothetical protein [Verrucomicrobiota bacterium]
MGHARQYGPAMVMRSLVALALLPAAAVLVRADVIQLKSQASISGTILAEKPDLLVIDIGYTVLTVPREQVAALERSTAA